MGHVAGSEGWLGHYLTWFVPGVGEFFHFTWGLERKQGPCIWGIITFFFYSKANAPYFPGVGVSIDRCIILIMAERVTNYPCQMTYPSKLFRPTT